MILQPSTFHFNLRISSKKRKFHQYENFFVFLFILDKRTSMKWKAFDSVKWRIHLKNGSNKTTIQFSFLFVRWKMILFKVMYLWLFGDGSWGSIRQFKFLYSKFKILWWVWCFSIVESGGLRPSVWFIRELPSIFLNWFSVLWKVLFVNLRTNPPLDKIFLNPLEFLRKKFKKFLI